MTERKPGNISTEGVDLTGDTGFRDEDGLKTREKLEARILKTASRVLAKAGGRKALISVSAPAFALFASACTPIFENFESTPVDSGSAPGDPRATEDFALTPSPEFVHELESYAQDAIDAQFEGLGFHDAKLIGDILTDTSGQNRFALFESSSPTKDSGEEYGAPFVGRVEDGNYIGKVSLLVQSETYPQEKNIITFASATFDSNTPFFDIQDPYLRKNIETGEIEVTEDGTNWIPLLGTHYAYNEIRARVGREGILRIPRLPTPAPNPTSLPTPTEIPAYTGPLAEIDSYKSRGHLPEVRTGGSLGDIPGYVFAPTYPMTLISISTVPGTEITEQKWGFSTNGTDFRFKNRALVCNIDSDVVGKDMSNLEIGTQYRLLYLGFEKPFSQSQLMDELSQDCKLVWGNLRGDPDDITRLKNFFTTGNSEGLNIDDEGEVVDLSNIIVPFLIMPW